MDLIKFQHNRKVRIELDHKNFLFLGLHSREFVWERLQIQNFPQSVSTNLWNWLQMWTYERKSQLNNYDQILKKDAV